MKILLFHHGIQQAGNHAGVKLTTPLSEGCYIKKQELSTNQPLIMESKPNNKVNNDGCV